MSLAGIAILLFVAANLLFALFVRTPEGGSEAFALESRAISGFRLACTMLASNLSAFTIFGVSGASYRLGWAYFPVMAFGTAFMAFSFILLGIPLRRLAAAGSWISPADAIRDRFGSRMAGVMFSLLLLAYTLPYIATQAGTAGSLIASALGIPAWAGSALVMAVVLLYILRGGMRSVTNSDIFQLVVMLTLGFAAFVIIARTAGGVPSGSSGQEALAAFSRAGKSGGIRPLDLAGYYILWFFADPMFPHLTQRFFAAKDDRAILQTMSLYPFVSLLIFFSMSAIGVFGSILEPGLSAKQADTIFTVLMMRYGGIAGPVFSMAALAALMSTLDSQILSSTSIIVEMMKKRSRSAGMQSEKEHGRFPTSLYRIAAAALAFGGWLISLRPPATILGFLSSTSFLGYASLAPVMLAAIYAPWIGAGTAIAGMLTGVVLVFAQGSGLLKPPIPAVVLNLLIIAAVLFAGGLLSRHTRKSLASQARFSVDSHFWMLLGTFFLLGLDFWNYRGPVILFAGIPLWVWYHVLAIAAMGICFLIFGSLMAGVRRNTASCDA